ncbi:peptidoglycan glycosyltransferase PbpC [Endothiovibrio diazotrophicus]
MLTALSWPCLRAWQLATLHAPPPTLLLLDRHGAFLTETGDPDLGYGYWPIEQLPPRLVAATLALEDRHFHDHPGVDPLAIGRALWQNLRASERVSGASTIAMQVARMQDPGPRTYGRKALEALTALLLTLRHGREAVLRHYLRLVPYGNRIHGIAYAARRYLDKPVGDLSWAEIALLAAIPQSPTRMNPLRPAGRRLATRRAERVLDTLAGAGLFDADALALARHQLTQLRIPDPAIREPAAMHALLRLADELHPPEHGEPRLHTSLDLTLQRRLTELTADRVAGWSERGAHQAAAVVIRRSDRQVLAWVGSPDYFATPGGAIDYARTARSPGSALKPFIYALALERGVIDSGTMLYDLPAFADGVGNIDGEFLGPLLPRQALANSRNVPATWLVAQTGVDEVYHFLRRLGLDDGRRPARHYGLGMAVGALPTTLERLLRAYGAIADDGVLHDLNWLRDTPPDPGRRVLSSESARLITRYLADPLARLPSFPRMGTTEYPFPVAVKTGTSQDYRDAWAVAWSTEYMVGAWVGREDDQPMERLGGADSAAVLVKAVLSELQPKATTGTADLAFPPPAGYRRFELCAYTGGRASGLCAPTLSEWLPENHPPPLDQDHLRIWIDRKTGEPAGPDTPADQREARTMVRLPARLTAWAKQHQIAMLPAPPPDTADHPAATATDPPAAPRLRESERPITLTLMSPTSDLHLLRNPEVPAELDTLTLRVDPVPTVAQVVWYVDDQPYQVSPAPFDARWPLTPGVHTIEARLPYRPERSRRVTVTVE